MTVFEWKSEYAVGNEIIDRQHARLLDLANIVTDACSNGRGVEVVDRAFDALYHYTRHHFGCEEELFQERPPSELSNHKKKHQALVDEVKQLHVANGMGLLVDTLESLCDWITLRLVPHMIDDDRALAAAPGERSESATATGD